MEALSSPACRPAGVLSSPTAAKPLPPYLRLSTLPTPSVQHTPRASGPPSRPLYSFSLSCPKTTQFLSPSSCPLIISSLNCTSNWVPKRTTTLPSSPISTPHTSPNDDDPQKAKLAQVAKRLESTFGYFNTLGNIAFWGQLVCTVVTSVILLFPVVVEGKITSPTAFYAAVGIAEAFVSTFWSYGNVRLAEKLRRTANDPSKAPPRADVVKSLKKSLVLNLLGMGTAAIIGMQATVGLLVAEALTSSVNPFYQDMFPPGYRPVLAWDVFLVQASAILSHFLGLVCSLGLLFQLRGSNSHAQAQLDIMDEY